jgi:hypothetical protein
MYKANRAVLFATAYLIIYILLIQVGAPIPVISTLFVASPFLLIWMTYCILKDNRFYYPELESHEEWGYADKPRETFYGPVCYKSMQPFQIQIDIAGNMQTLLVYADPDKSSYDVFENKHRLGILYKDQDNGGIWCSKDPMPLELINMIGDAIDAYEV